MKMPLVRLAKGAWSFVRLVQNMDRTDEVFAVMAELATPDRLQPLVEHFAKDEQGALALRDRPRLGPVDLEALRRLPPATLGREFAEHMLKNKLELRFYPEVAGGDDIGYMRLHLYETHDIWHVVTGFSTAVAGEVGLQAFYAAQFPQGPLPPVLMAAGLLNTVLHNQDENAPRLDAIARGWVLGRAARPLFGVEWAKHWATPLAEVRRRYGIAQPGALRVQTG